MIIGVPKEIKNNEFRVSATPSGVHALVKAGHSVLVETSAGVGSAITDADYVAAGATIISTSDEVWTKADLILKVKEPIAPEYPKMRKGQILFTYLHLAGLHKPLDVNLFALWQNSQAANLPHRPCAKVRPMGKSADLRRLFPMY